MIEKWRERAIEVLNLCNKNKKYIAMNKQNQWTIYSNKPKLYKDDGCGWSGEFPICLFSRICVWLTKKVYRI